MSPAQELAGAVLEGLTAAPKTLPPVLFYDDLGSSLFEAITMLPEYYLTRAERSILLRDADAITERVLADAEGPVAVIELGAGTATKTTPLLDALARTGAAVTYVPVDVSASALEVAVGRLALERPTLRVSPLLGRHEDALRLAAAWEGTVVSVFLGSSIGNYDERNATELLAAIRGPLGRRGALVLGVDRAKRLDALHAAYDDPTGVTAAFNRNVLGRINRELDADFELAAFRHVAIWNERAEAMEMHLESTRSQVVAIRKLEMTVRFAEGERIHTESSHKYSDLRIGRLLRASGLVSVARFDDDEARFSVHVARQSAQT